jgi:hypothetical protein
MGPATVSPDRRVDVAPHPHIGLQTVTWLLAGELVHRDSLGSEQVIRPGQLNLMTAGRGVAHSEEGTDSFSGRLHGVQLWIAQPSLTRDGAAGFEHHAELPKIDLEGANATVLVGDMAGVSSPARRDTEHFGIELELHGPVTTVPLEPLYEHGLVVLTGTLSVEGRVLAPGELAYLSPGRDECSLATSEPTRALLFGGIPFKETVLMWWNFVARSEDEITAAYRDWAVADPRFGYIASTLPRVEVGPPPWMIRSDRS